MKIRMPLKKELETYQEDEVSRYCPNFLRVRDDLLPRLPQYVSTGFSKSKEALFNIPDKESFFSPSQRSRIIWECLTRMQYAESEIVHTGITKLLGDGTFEGGYPLHDGPWESMNGKPAPNLRAILYDQWGRITQFFRFQPISYIRNYFGERVGFYFAWMEFYTLMLIPAVIVGLICLVYAIVTARSDIPSTEICTDTLVRQTIMCPICQTRCPYWRLKDSCHFTQVAYLIDNPATICFATFMALWSSLFLLLWRRKQAILSWNFDTHDVLEQEEPVRPELEARVDPDAWKVNPVTGVKEPYVPPWRRFLQGALSGSVVLFMIFLVFAATFASIVYRISMNVAIYAAAKDPTKLEEEQSVVKFSTYLVSITGALLNLVVILVLNAVYFRIAKWLTELEYPRTQTAYEESLTIKYYIFEFVNTYTSLFYVAFFKGRYPAAVPKARILGNLPVDRCDKGGCLIELTIQLAVLYLGSSLSNFVMEIVVPSILRRLRSRQHVRRFEKRKHDQRWEKDYDLVPFPTMGLFLEYSRMVTQFGFITMFVAAFPVAPIFALINNIVEIRMNAYKYLTLFQRPVPLWTRNIGAWGKILENVARFSVVTNIELAYIVSGCTIVVATYVSALSILAWRPRFGGSAILPPDYYPPIDLPVDPPDRERQAGENSADAYREFRNPPTDVKQYGFNIEYWHVLAARVLMVLVFEHFVMVITKLISFFVPEVPPTLKEKLSRENFLAKEAFYEAESRKQQPLRRGNTPKTKVSGLAVPRTEL